jgi:hypothetical protein
MYPTASWIHDGYMVDTSWILENYLVQPEETAKVAKTAKSFWSNSYIVTCFTNHFLS